MRELCLHPHKAMYLQVLEEDGSNLRALLNRGTAYRHLEQYEDAKKDLVKARKSKIVWIELEMEMRALKQSISGKSNWTEPRCQGIYSQKSEHYTEE